MTKNSALVFAALVIAAALLIGRAPPTEHPVAPPARSDSPETTSRQPDSRDAIVVQREADGHFYTNASVNGTPIRFMIDTGASSVALTRTDAQKAGMFLSENDFNQVGRAAVGEIRLRSVTFDRVTVGSIEARDVHGVVIGGDSEVSLLGQSFLATLGSVTIEDNRMVLRPA